MISKQEKQIESTLNELYIDSKYDTLHIIKGAAKSVFRPMHPLDFKDAYLSISKEQGENLIYLITENNVKNIVEFGTSFGISTLFLAIGAMKTGGHIITTELLESKAKRAIEHFKMVGVDDLIEVRIGDALETLRNHREPIDLLVLDGWKNLYLPLFQMLELNFHAKTLIYVDNAYMTDSQPLLKMVNQDSRYQLQSMFHGKVVLISMSQPTY